MGASMFILQAFSTFLLLHGQNSSNMIGLSSNGFEANYTAIATHESLNWTGPNIVVPTRMLSSRQTPLNKWYLLFLTFFLGFCGCDRCYAGDWCLGCAKCITGGGFVIWGIMDYFVIVINAYHQKVELHSLSWDVKFDFSTIDAAYHFSLICLTLNVLNLVLPCLSLYCCPEFTMNTLGTLSLYTGRFYRFGTASQEAFALKLRKAGLVSAHPTHQELKAAFDRIDTNGDGILSEQEMEARIRAICPDEGEVQSLMRLVDSDGDGRISKKEFFNAFEEISRHNAPKGYSRDLQRSAHPGSVNFHMPSPAFPHNLHLPQFSDFGWHHGPTSPYQQHVQSPSQPQGNFLGVGPANSSPQSNFFSPHSNQHVQSPPHPLMNSFSHHTNEWAHSPHMHH